MFSVSPVTIIVYLGICFCRGGSLLSQNGVIFVQSMLRLPRRVLDTAAYRRHQHRGPSTPDTCSLLVLCRTKSRAWGGTPAVLHITTRESAQKHKQMPPDSMGLCPHKLIVSQKSI